MKPRQGSGGGRPAAGTLKFFGKKGFTAPNQGATYAASNGATRSAATENSGWQRGKTLRRTSLVGDSLMVEQRTLTPLVQVRVLVPQPKPR